MTKTFPYRGVPQEQNTSQQIHCPMLFRYGTMLTADRDGRYSSIKSVAPDPKCWAVRPLFTVRLLTQRKVNKRLPRTRDTFRSLLLFAQKRLRKSAVQPGFIESFVDHLENQWRNGSKSRST